MSFYNETVAKAHIVYNLYWCDLSKKNCNVYWVGLNNVSAYLEQNMFGNISIIELGGKIIGYVYKVILP